MGTDSFVEHCCFRPRVGSRLAQQTALGKGCGLDYVGHAVATTTGCQADREALSRILGAIREAGRRTVDAALWRRVRCISSKLRTTLENALRSSCPAPWPSHRAAGAFRPVRGRGVAP